VHKRTADAQAEPAERQRNQNQNRGYIQTGLKKHSIIPAAGVSSETYSDAA